MKRTLKRELKVLEIAKKEGMETSTFVVIFTSCDSRRTGSCGHKVQSRWVALVGESRAREALSSLYVPTYDGCDRGKDERRTLWCLSRCLGSCCETLSGEQSSVDDASITWNSQCLICFGSTILTKWFSFTRLETRTKESNMCASV